MASNSINCNCFATIDVRKMALKLFVLFNLLCLLQRTFAAPDYKTLHKKLSIREEDEKASRKGHDGSPIIAEIGKLFKFSLHEYTLKSRENNTATVQLFEHGKDKLPLWLSYNEKKNKLVGIPTNRDAGKVKIIFKTSVKGLKKKYKFEIVVKEGKNDFYCRDGNPGFVAAAIFSVDIANYDGLSRLKLLRQFSDYIDVAVHEFRIEERKRDSVFDPSMEIAGPGDGIVSKAPGIVVTWKVICKLGYTGDPSVSMLKQASGNKFIYDSTGVPFLGWYVYRNHFRRRRQANPAATPVATPAASVPIPTIVTSVISGTPVISATPSLIIKSTSTMAIKPTTSTIMVKPTPVVTTKQPTPEVTTQQITTPSTKPTIKSTKKMKTTTEKPQVTTKEPATTKEKITTMKPVTTTMKPETTTMKPETTTMKPETTTMKPETTTMKPETTTMKPVTTQMMPVVTTAEPLVTMEPVTIKPTVKDMPPVLKNSIDLIDVKAGQAFKVKIKQDVFEDDIDKDTYGLTLALKKNAAQQLMAVDESIIYLDTTNHYLYGLFMLDRVGDNSFAIQATDSAGNQENAVFNVKVTDENIVYNDIFNVTIDVDYDNFMKNVKNKVELVEKIAKATAVDYKTIRAQNFYRGSVVVSYSCEVLQTDQCNSIEAEAYKAKLEGSEFKDAMAPDYIITRTTSKKRSNNCGGLNASKAPRIQKKSEYKWWEVVLIPVIVIAVLLLVIGLIFFFLYRRKRRYEPQSKDKNTFLYQKKPVIFREEYEEKPDVVSLEPLILPNEKAPLTSSASTEGEGSSSGSTEGDEKALIDNKTDPQTPPPNGPPRSPPYGRSPPPYSEP